MAGELKHHIRKSITRFYLRRFRGPVFFLAVILVFAFLFPIVSFIFPKSFSTDDVPADFYKDRQIFVTANLDEIFFTGYRKDILGVTAGYYYYYVKDDRCTIVLLSGETCDEGAPKLTDISFGAGVLKTEASEKELLSFLAQDLSWTPEGIGSNVSSYVLNEPFSENIFAKLLRLIIILSVLYAVVNLVLCIIYMHFPLLSPPVRKLSVYGNANRLLRKAEEELSTLPQLATEDMFITQHFFLETSRFGIAIVPISEIIWIYKYSTLHRFLWHVSTISYTLYITTTHRQVIRCPKNVKSDIDGIMDYLAEANHSILTGFSEQNREEAAKRQGHGAFVTKLMKFLKSSPEDREDS